LQWILQAEREKEADLQVPGKHGRVRRRQSAQEPVPGVQAEKVPQHGHEQRWLVRGVARFNKKVDELSFFFS
jgi:hypothetical protein